MTRIPRAFPSLFAAGWFAGAALLTAYVAFDAGRSIAHTASRNAPELREERWGAQARFFQALASLPWNAEIVLENAGDGLYYFASYFAFPRPVRRANVDERTRDDAASGRAGAAPRGPDPRPVYRASFDQERGTFRIKSPPPGSPSGAPHAGDRAARMPRAGPLHLIAALTVAILLIHVMGYAMLALIDARFGRDHDPRFTLERWTISWPLGTLVLTLILFAAGCLPVGISRASAVIPAVLVAVAAAWLSGRRTPGTRHAAPKGLASAGRASGAGAWTERFPLRLLSTRVIAALLLLLLVALAFATIAYPVMEWDALAIWTMRAKQIHFERSLLAPAFLDPAATPYPHPDYPLLLPLLETWGFLLMGSANDWAVKILLVPYALTLAGLLYTFARDLAGTRFGLTAAFLGCALPAAAVRWSEGSLASAYADYPLAVCMTGAGVCLYRGLTPGARLGSPARNLLLASLLAAAAAWTKNEGSLFLALFLVVLATAGATGAAPRRAAFSGGAVALLAALPVWVYKHALPPAPTDIPLSDITPATLAANAGRLPFLARSFAGEILDPTHWLLLWPAAILVLAGFALTRGRGRDGGRSGGGALVALAALAAGQLLAYLLVFWTTPEDPEWLVLTSLKRLALHVSGLGMVLVVAGAGALAALQVEDPGPDQRVDHRAGQVSQ